MGAWEYTTAVKVRGIKCTKKRERERGWVFDVLLFVSACRVKHWPAHQHTCKRVARCAECLKTDVPLRKCSRCHEVEYCSPGE